MTPNEPVRLLLRVVAYNCHGWSNGKVFAPDLLERCDFLLIQEHWLADCQHHFLTFDGFFNVFVSGFDSGKILCVRPYGGCAILYRQDLAGSVKQVKTQSRRFCAVKFNRGGQSLLLVNVCLPTDYRNDLSTQQMRDTLGELGGFITTESFDCLMIVGDWNTVVCHGDN